MSDSEWSQLLSSPGFLGELYDGAPPAPDYCELFYVHLDERADSVTLGFDTRTIPTNPLPEWGSRRCNAFTFYLVFTDTQGVRVDGWGPSVAGEVHLITSTGGQLEVTLGHTGSGMTFEASSVTLTTPGTYLASDSP
jgi:hypothetical protein